MICSTCIGVLSKERKFFKQVKYGTQNKENFYYTEIKINNKAFPVVGSEFVLLNMEGKVALETYLRSEPDPKSGKMLTFFYVMFCSQVPPETKDSKVIEVKGLVGAGVVKRIVQKSGKEIVRFKLRYSSYDSRRTTVHCVAEAFNARRLSSIKEDDVVSIKGIVGLTQSKNIEIRVLTVLEHSSKGGD